MTARGGSAASLSGRRVLVVEDDGLIAMDLADLLESRGAAVIGPVPSVRAALAAIASDMPEAVLLDVNLRGTRSTPVAEALHEAGVPFLLLTGYSRQRLSEPVLLEAPLLPKPVNGDALVRELARLLSSDEG